MSFILRLDQYLVSKHIATGRDRAKEMIQSGIIYINGCQCTKPSASVPESAIVDIRGNILKYVSRGGLKLEKALEEFDIQLDNTVCVDIGASTGGFTDCMLQSGATKIYAIDVGTNQLANNLRINPQVVVMEQTNIRYLDKNIFEDMIDFVSIDVSFISLTYVLPVAYDILCDTGELVCLIKPQFEAGKRFLNKKGVVKNSKVHKEVLVQILLFSQSLGFAVKGLTYSPITGPEGNIEYLLHLSKNIKDNATDIYTIIDYTIDETQQIL